jgi:hypothetical protein
MIDNNPLRFGSPGTFGISICNVSRRPGSGYSETVILQLGWQDCGTGISTFRVVGLDKMVARGFSV